MPRKRGFMVVTGVEELDSNLNALATDGATRASKAGLRAGLKILAKAQAAAAPRGRTGSVAASIGSRLVSGRRGSLAAKAGVNVGPRKPPRAGAALVRPGRRRLTARARRARLAALAPRHAHLVALGTRPRFLKSTGLATRLAGRLFHALGGRPRGRGYRGVMPANHFIRQAFGQSAGRVRAAIREGVAAGIAREVNKLGKKTGRAVGVS